MMMEKLVAKNKSIIQPINGPEYEGLRQKLKVIYAQNPKMISPFKPILPPSKSPSRIARHRGLASLEHSMDGMHIGYHSPGPGGPNVRGIGVAASYRQQISNMEKKRMSPRRMNRMEEVKDVYLKPSPRRKHEL